MGSVDNQKLNEEVDRFSNLPSCIISHILSFLPTKYAVRTSILSTTWKHNWKSITNLDFDGSSYSQYPPTAGMQVSFVSFVYRVLLQLKFSSLNKFRLQRVWNLQNYDASHINSWVSAALLHNVREIDIGRISFNRTCFLPSDLFKCQTLVVLKLSFGVLKVPNSVCLPNLKVLNLLEIEFKDEASSSTLLSSSSVLEDLTLDSCVLANESVLKISSPGLKKLILDGCWKMCESRFVLDAPQLEHLEIAGCSPEHSSQQNASSLFEARLNVILGSAEEYATKVFVDLKSKSHLKLKQLYYGDFDICGHSLLKDMLESSPQLETLVLAFACPLPLENIAASICKRLKVVEMLWFDGEGKDMEFVKHILKNAKVLETIGIHSTIDLMDIEDELLAFPRASTSCEFVFYEG